MDVKKIIADAAALRDGVKTLVAAAKAEAPHLVNAAGALHAAVVNLEGHLAAQAIKSAPPAKPAEAEKI